MGSMVMWKSIDHRVRVVSGATVERVYGWNGELFPRLSLCLWSMTEGENRPWQDTSPALKITCSERRTAKSWWHERSVPKALIDDLVEMLVHGEETEDDE